MTTIITKSDFETIVEAHGEEAYLIQIQETIEEVQAESSPFDMIYGFADPSGEAGSEAVELKRGPFKCLIQEVLTGQEAWMAKVGTLNIGDAVLVCETSYTDATGEFVIKSSDIIESPTRSNLRYEVESPAHNIDGNQNIFYQVILRKKQSS